MTDGGPTTFKDLGRIFEGWVIVKLRVSSNGNGTQEMWLEIEKK